MTARLPSLNGLRAFEAAARHLSFTQAASELNVTQTAISHQIKRLEEELGIQLFIRQNRALTLSPAAKEYLPGIRAAFNDLRLATDRLGYFAHWITPEGMPKRFDTHFFITTAPAEQQAAHDRLETSEGIWISPAEALASSERGEFPLVFATIHQLRELAAFHSVQEALESTTMQHVATHVPILEQRAGGARVYLPGDDDNKRDVPENMTRS